MTWPMVGTVGSKLYHMVQISAQETCHFRHNHLGAATVPMNCPRGEFAREIPVNLRPVP
jgi:hypothetical protein